jgi:predicted transcriptional regulator
MIESGLLLGRDELVPPKRKWVELTDKGRKVAEKLEGIEKVLKE